MHIYIQVFCTRGCTYLYMHVPAHTDIDCTKTAGFGRKLIPFPTFHSAYCFSLLLITAPLHNESPCRSCPRMHSDLKRLRYRRTSCMQQLRGELIGLYHVKRFGSGERARLLSIALYSSAVDAVFLPFYCTTGESLSLDIVKKLDPPSNVDMI